MMTKSCAQHAGFVAVLERALDQGWSFVGHQITHTIFSHSTAWKSPWQNPPAEWLPGSIGRECLGYLVVIGETHLDRNTPKYATTTTAPGHICPWPEMPRCTPACSSDVVSCRQSSAASAFNTAAEDCSIRLLLDFTIGRGSWSIRPCVLLS